MFSIDQFILSLNSPADLQRQHFHLPGEEEPAGVLLFLSTLTNQTEIDQILLLARQAGEAKHGPEGARSQQRHPALASLAAVGHWLRLDPQRLAAKLYEGHCLLLLYGAPEALAISVPAWQNRSITPPETESSLIGPRDAFVEDIEINLSLIRSRIRHEDLIVQPFTIGQVTRSEVVLIYMKGLASPDILQKIVAKLERIAIDGVTDTSQIGHLVVGKSKWASPFPLLQTTERPDKTISSLLEGRFVVLMDNSPTALVLPVTLTALYQTADDYYFPYLSGTFLRFIRLAGLFMTLYLPALYVSITTVNRDVLRIQFMLAIAASREGVPYPAYIEVSIMMLLLELINEASVRLPRVIGGTATIVGGLIIGTAAAQAHLISNIMIVVTAATAIGSFTTPNYMVGVAFRIWSYLLIALAIPLGLYGMVLGTALLFLYLCGLKSFGTAYLSPFDTMRIGDLLRDAMIRAPISLRRNRPSTYRPNLPNSRRIGRKEGEKLL